MQITNTPQISHINIQHKKQPNFKGLLCCDASTKEPIDSWFFRDYKTLERAAQEIKHEFPNGTNILDYACSNGEEIISMKALLPENQYKIIGYDKSTHALKLANKGIYTVFSNWYDSFLLPEEKTQGKFEDLKKYFHSVMEEITPPVEDRFINNKAGFFDIKNRITGFKEIFYKLKDNHADNIDIRRGDIQYIEKNRIPNVGAIFFRNALYQIVDNNITESLNGTFNRSSEYQKPVIEQIKEFVDKIYTKLEKGGIFVIGDHIKDHLFISDKFADQLAPENESIRFKDSIFFDPETKSHKANAELKIFKNSPLEAILEKDGKFAPIGFSKTFLSPDGIKITVPTIWKKIK